MTKTQPLSMADRESQSFLEILADENRVKANRRDGVKTVLVVLSARAMVYDMESLKVKIRYAYPGAEVFFLSTLGTAIGALAPKKIDLLIDFTGPRQRHKWFLSRALRARATYCVGRTAGFFREFIYDGIYDETKDRALPRENLPRERVIQKHILELAGVPLSQKGLPNEDRSHEIASELPPLRNR